MTTVTTTTPCQCPDDRCAGYHHEAGEPCGCGDYATLAALVAPPASTLAREAAGFVPLTFNWPDRLTTEQRRSIAARMRTTFAALVQDATRARAAEGVER